MNKSETISVTYNMSNSIRYLAFFIFSTLAFSTTVNSVKSKLN